MSERPSYDVVVVGGGPAGLTAAIYTIRLGHRTAVFEMEGGRHAAVKDVHNLFGVSEDVSGRDLSVHAARQFEEYGGDLYPDEVRSVRRDGSNHEFRVTSAHATVEADRVVFATGFSDHEPDVEGLRRFTGRGLHYCLHCDGYVLGDERVFVLGHGDHAAHVAMVMLNFTDDVDLLLDGAAPDWSDETETQLRAHPITRIDTEVVSAFEDEEDEEDEEEEEEEPGDEPWLGGFEFADGIEREYIGGFAMYGKTYNNELPGELGCELDDDGAVVVDERGETSVDGAYAVGDVTHGQNQTTIALGDGARTGIALHKDLRTFPLSPEECDDRATDDIEVPGAPADIRGHMRRDRGRDHHAGLRDPSPDR